MDILVADMTAPKKGKCRIFMSIQKLRKGSKYDDI